MLQQTDDKVHTKRGGSDSRGGKNVWSCGGTQEHRWRGVTQDRGVVCPVDAYFYGNRKAGRWCTAASVPPHHACGRPGSDRSAVLRAIKKPRICVWEPTGGTVTVRCCTAASVPPDRRTRYFFETLHTTTVINKRYSETDRLQVCTLFTRTTSSGTLRRRRRPSPPPPPGGRRRRPRRPVSIDRTAPSPRTPRPRRRRRCGLSFFSA